MNQKNQFVKIIGKHVGFQFSSRKGQGYRWVKRTVKNITLAGNFSKIQDFDKEQAWTGEIEWMNRTIKVVAIGNPKSGAWSTFAPNKYSDYDYWN